MAWPGLTWRNLLEAGTRQELDQFVSLLAGYLAVQHKDDGSHGHITFESLDSFNTDSTVSIDGSGAIAIDGFKGLTYEITSPTDSFPVDASIKTVEVLGTGSGSANASTWSNIQSGLDLNGNANRGTINLTAGRLASYSPSIQIGATFPSPYGDGIILTAATVRVAGDMVVTGSFSPAGNVVITGTLAWGGGSAIPSSNSVALLAGATFTGNIAVATAGNSDISITAGSSSDFAGLIFNQGATQTWQIYANTGATPAMVFLSGGATAAMSLTPAGALTVTAGFGCNGATAQTAAASGGALNAYGAGANGLDTGANMSALHALVVAMRAALVANGIMS